MYSEREKKTLEKATVLLLRKSIENIQDDKQGYASTLLDLQAFIQLAWNDHERCKRLVVLIITGMWEMFKKEIRK